VLQRARELEEDLVAEYPDEPAYRADLAYTLNNFGLFFFKMNRHAEAKQAFQVGTDLLTALVARHPTVAEYAEKLVVMRGNLADEAEPLEAERLLRQNLRLVEDLLARSPSRRRYQSRLPLTCAGLGALLFKTGRLSEAKEFLNQEVDLRRQATIDFPDTPHNHRALATALRTLADVLRREGKLSEARQRLEGALAARRRALQLSPGYSDDEKALAADSAELAGLQK
jgi:tetratricopeptide (TPR) repeat protein